MLDHVHCKSVGLPRPLRARVRNGWRPDTRRPSFPLSAPSPTFRKVRDEQNVVGNSTLPYFWVWGRGFLHPVSVRRFPSFRTQPLENLTPLPMNKLIFERPSPWRKYSKQKSCYGDRVYSLPEPGALRLHQEGGRGGDGQGQGGAHGDGCRGARSLYICREIGERERERSLSISISISLPLSQIYVEELMKRDTVT